MSLTNIVISTSRKPSQRTRSLCKELQLLFPSAVYLQRGKSNFEELLESAEHAQARMLLIIGEREGNPGSFELYQLRDAEEPVISLDIDGVRLAREFGAHVRTRSRAITFSSDSHNTSISLRELFESYFEDEFHSRNFQAEDGARLLSIVDTGNGGMRLTFKVAETGQDLGPSITGRLKQR